MQWREALQWPKLHVKQTAKSLIPMGVNDVDDWIAPGTSLGAVYRADPEHGGSGRCDFLVWAPYADKVELCLLGRKARTEPMTAGEDGYFAITVEDIARDSLYLYHLFAKQAATAGTSPPLKRADPASRLQPQGVHGPSQLVVDDFPWQAENWRGLELSDYIIYEAHVGTATAEGTFTALIELLPMLRDLGVTALELMPVAEFPGSRNWGYDGVYPFSAHHAYGGPQGLKQLVDACHQAGMAVVMDVVYNHLGPEGNYLNDFGPYFTDAYTTPWGRAINFDGPYSDPVRRFFLENARYWLRDCRIDALRVDAVHGIYDFSARPFLSQLTALVQNEAERQQRRIFCIAESDLNDTRVILPRQRCGLGFDAQWNDDFHHALHTLLTGEKDGYYADFGSLNDLAKAWEHGYVYDGRYSKVRKRCHGNDARRQPAGKFVVFIQNHDQVGNRMRGERLSSLVSFEGLKLAAGCVLFSPYIPLLFMGEAYAERAPFPYFISHGDPELIEAVRKGRRREFSTFSWAGEPPDPQEEAAFDRAKCNPDLRFEPGRHAVLYNFYREAIRLRKTIDALKHLHRDGMQVTAAQEIGLLVVRRRHGQSQVMLMFHFGRKDLPQGAALPDGRWRKRLDSADSRWQGPGSRAPEGVVGRSWELISLKPLQMILWERESG